jgi:NADPH:quinone reductase-like Zn-dependent oxidoreductase
LEVVERELRDPRPDEVRVRVQAASVSLVDVQARQGRGPFQQKASFVAVLTEINGYAEYVYVRRNPTLRIPDSVDAAAAVTLVLNYLVAYQVLHRRSRVQAGDRVLIIGAAGGIGTALCELGQLAGLVMYGVDSASKHHALARYGVIPIDPRTEDVAETIRRAEPDGLAAVFDGVGGAYVKTALSVLRPGGVLVEFANPGSKRGLLRLLARKAALRLTGGGRRLRLYGTNTWRYDRRPLLRDWRALFTLLAEGRISPVIARTFPLNEASAANALLESGTVIGNLVLLPEQPASN